MVMIDQGFCLNCSKGNFPDSHVRRLRFYRCGSPGVSRWSASTSEREALLTTPVDCPCGECFGIRIVGEFAGNRGGPRERCDVARKLDAGYGQTALAPARGGPRPEENEQLFLYVKWNSFCCGSLADSSVIEARFAFHWPLAERRPAMPQAER